jgi:hypothetical protein
MPADRLTALALAALLAACNDKDDHDHDHETDIDTEAVEAEDVDGDGFTVEAGDCNDLNDLIFPGARERSFDQIDSNCDEEDQPVGGEDRYEEALALLDTDESGDISLAEFEAACHASAQVFGEARPGVVHTQTTCGGTHLCRGMVLHTWNELIEHDCRGVNGCAGWSCVETAEGSDRDGATVFVEANCAWCHAGEDGKFKVQVPPGDDVETAVATFFDRSDARFRAAIAFGLRGISPGDVAGSNMPAYYDRLSLAEIDAVIAYMRTMQLEGASWQWGDVPEE